MIQPSTKAYQTMTIMGRSAQSVVARVLDVGSGLPVIFLHGLVGLNDHWEDVVGMICNQVRCIMLELPLLDLRGEDCSLAGVVELTERAIVELLHGQPAILVGNSFGGHVALHVALNRPELVKGLVLAGSSGLIERTTVREVQVRPSRAWLIEKIGELFFDRSHVRETDIDRAHSALSDRRGARAMIKLSRTARKNHLGSRMGAVRTPTLLIWGRQDIVTPPEAAEEFHRLLPDSRLVWFDQCGHVPMLEKPEAFAEAMRCFVREVESCMDGVDVSPHISAQTR